MSQEVLAVLVCTAIAIPVGLVSWSVNTIHRTAVLLTQVSARVEVHAGELTDHELRIRNLERRPTRSDGLSTV